MNELIQRLEYAIARLEDAREDDVSHDEYVRISGKVQGLALALSYTRETVNVRS